MATCEEIKIKITLLAEYSLSEKEKAEVEAHIGKCSECEAAYEETLTLLSLMKCSRLPEPSSKFSDELSSKVYVEWSRRRKETKATVFRFRRLATAAGIAAALLVVFITYSMFQNKQSVPMMQQAMKQSYAPEDLLIATFTYSPLKVNATTASTANVESNSGVTDAKRASQLYDNQLSAYYPSDNSDLINVIESLSDDEAKDLFESLEQTAPDDNS
jgi:hypothetical protein